MPTLVNDKNFKNDNFGEFGEGNTNSPELSLLNFLPLIYHHRHFLAPLISHIFFTLAFWGLHPFFTAWPFWYRYVYVVVTGNE